MVKLFDIDATLGPDGSGGEVFESVKDADVPSARYMVEADGSDISLGGAISFRLAPDFQYWVQTGGFSLSNDLPQSETLDLSEMSEVRVRLVNNSSQDVDVRFVMVV